MSWMELFEILVNGFLSLTIVASSLVLEVARVLDPTLKINMETIYLFHLIFKLNHLLNESQVLQDLILNNIY